MQNIELSQSLITVPVAIAVIEKTGKIFISKRADNVDLAGLWEFPGGKIEKHETVEQTLIRECQEEIGITPTYYRPLVCLSYILNNKKIILNVYLVTKYKGKAFGKEKQETKWIKKADITKVEFPPINQKILTALNLPTTYCITPELENNLGETVYLKQLAQNIQQANIEILQFRNPKIDNEKRQTLVLKLQKICKEHNCILMENIRFEYLNNIQTKYIHLSSKALNHISKNHLSKATIVGASCHNLEELKMAEEKGCHYAFLSPVQKTKTHPEANPLGWQNFAKLVHQVNIPVYALGGLVLDDLELSYKYGGQGIAGIGFCNV